MQIEKVVEWKSIYIDYELMDSLLEPFQEINIINISKKKSLHQNASFAYNSMIVYEISFMHELELLNKKFVEQLCSDMKRCDQFYNLHQQLIQVKFRKFIYNLFVYLDLQKEKSIQQRLYILKQYCEMLYQECNLLGQYAKYNKIVITKLIKKYRKQVFLNESQSDLLRMKDQFNSIQFCDNIEQLEKLQIRLKLIYRNYLLKNNQQSQLKQLKYHNMYKGFTRKEQLLIGMYLGISFCIILFIIQKRSQLYNNFYKNQFYYDLYFPMFRGLGLLILYYWSLIFCVYCWIKGNVGYRSIFNFKYHSSSINQLVRRAAVFTFVYFFILIVSLEKELFIEQQKDEKQYLIDYITQKIPFDPAIGPFILWMLILIYMLLPTKKYFNAKGRRYFWRVVYTSLLSGFYDCPFVNGWGTDQLLSLSLMLKDFAYTTCFYFKYFQDTQNFEYQAECGDPKNLEIGLIVCLIPIGLRFIQMGRCMYDAKKVTTDDICVLIIYVEVSMVTIFSYLSQFGLVYIIVWIISFCALACNAYFWDVKKDWGLFQPDSRNKYLRNILAFPKYYYYIAIILELILRFAWILSISPNMASIIHVWSPVFSLIMALFEVGRRTIWNIFRIENVHIQNVGELRAVYPIQLPFEQLIDKEAYNQIKEMRKTQVDPINISLLSSNQSSTVAGQYYQFRSSLKSQSQEDEDSLNQLQKQEHDLIAENMYEDRRRESSLNMKYSEFKVDHLNDRKNWSKSELLSDLKVIKELIKQMN